MRENQNQLIKDIVLVVVICIIATVFVYCMFKSTDNEKVNNSLFQKIHTDSLTMDSLKMKITHDSLAHVDSLRVAHINYLNNQDNKNKDERDEANALIQYATDKQLDSLWAVYSTKISN